MDSCCGYPLLSVLATHKPRNPGCQKEIIPLAVVIFVQLFPQMFRLSCFFFFFFFFKFLLRSKQTKAEILKGLPREGERKCNTFQFGHSDLRSFKMTVNSSFVCQVQSLLRLCRAEWKCPKMATFQISLESESDSGNLGF